jgi:tetratricopeptide (TPR) repeat protein
MPRDSTPRQTTRTRRRPTAASAAAAALVAAVFAVAAAPSRAADDGTQLVEEARTRVRKHDVRGALTMLDKAITADPGNAEAHILYQDVGRVALGVESMTTWYRKKSAEKPDDPLLAFLAARMLPADQTLPAMEKLALQFPTSPWPHVGKARAYETASRFTESAAEYDAAVAAASGEVRFKAYKACGLEAAGAYAAAAEAWKIVLAVNPKDRAARMGLGESLRKTGAFDDAVATFTEVLKNDPADAEAHYRVGITLIDAGRLDDAMVSFDSALAADRSLVAAYCAAAEAATKKALATADKEKRDPVEKDFEKAIAYGGKAVAVGNDVAEAHFACAAVQEAAGEDNATHYDAAKDEYDKALNLVPTPCPLRVRILCGKAYVLLRLAKWDEAIASADKAIGIDDHCAAAFAHAGHALAAQGKQDDAIKKYYLPGLKIAPDDARLHHAYGVALWESSKEQPAKKELEAAVKCEPDNARYKLTLGQLYYDLKMYKQAGDLLVKVVDARPNDIESWRTYGRVCCALKDWDQGVEAYETIIKLLEAAKPAAPPPAAAGGGAATAPANAPAASGNDDLLKKAHLYLAIIYQDDLKKRDKAKAHIKKFTELGGTEPNLQNWIDSLLKDP